MKKRRKVTLPDNGWPHPDELPRYHAEDIADYRDNVLLPVLRPIEKKLEDVYYGNRPELNLSNAEQERLRLLYMETAKGLFLALGAVWERQLRGYLLRYALKLGNEKLKCVANGLKRDGNPPGQ